jgi:hypothetical protein
LSQSAADSAEKAWEAQQNIGQNQQQIDIQRRAELANEAAMGSKAAQAAIKEQDAAANRALRTRQIQLQSQKQAWAVQQAERAGHKIDASASKALGYVVDVQGRPVLDENGHRIPVKNATKGPGGGHQKQLQAAGQEALSLRGTPVAAAKFVHKPDGSVGPPAGQYVGRPGAKGLLPDGTTNDPNRAQRSGRMAFRSAVNYLAVTYGITKAEATKILLSIVGKPSNW